LGFSYQNERCLFSLIFVLQITMNWKIGNNGQTYPILIDWLMCCSWTFLWQIFNTYSGREWNSLIYKYYIEIQTWRIFNWRFSIERLSISATVLTRWHTDHSGATHRYLLNNEERPQCIPPHSNYSLKHTRI
jgi:hypothetical protein